MTDQNETTGKHHAEDAPAPEDTKKDPKHTADKDTKKDPKHTADKEVPQQGPETIEETIDEWGEETFPASDPPANY